MLELDDSPVDPIKRAIGTLEQGVHDIAGRGKTKVVVFSLNEGQNFGNQVIPEDEIDGMVDAVESFCENMDLIPELEDANQQKYIPTYEVMSSRICKAPIKRTKVGYLTKNGEREKLVAEEDSPLGIVLFSRTGRGIKPNIIPVEKFPEYLQFLKKIQAKLRQINSAKAQE